MKKKEAYNSSRPETASSNSSVSRSIAVKSRGSAFATVWKRILAELKDYNFDEDDLFAVHLALDEAFANAVVHGNKMDPNKKVKIEYYVDSDRIEISVTDEGGGFEPDSVPDPRYGPGLDETSGRGLLLMNSFMDAVKFNEPGNSVYMLRYKKTGHDKRPKLC
jgi:serine/threonine-protein kinase RsbW